MLHGNEIPPFDKTSLDVLASIPWTGRAVLLVDLDAFFASVEQLDHPGWRGKPVIVGGGADRRGVVSTASYEARKYGVRSAMPSSTAQRLCPDAIWTVGHYSRYKEMSNAVMSILFDETPHVQQVSIDEAFMDVTPTEINREHPVLIARRIQERVEKLGVSCSIGLGTTKAIAKLASDMDKPRGLTVVLPGSEANFMAPLPVRALSGIGPAAERVLKNHGIETLGDLANADEESVILWLGKQGQVMLNRARGLEEDPIDPDNSVKSVSNEVSFAEDLVKREDITGAISSMAAKVGRRLRRKGLKGSTLALKVRYSDRSVRSVQRPIGQPSDDEYLFMEMLEEMLPDVWSTGMALRLVGVAVTGFDTAKDEPEQLSLFDDTTEAEVDVAAESETARRRGLMSATDKVKERFGESAVRFGRELRLSGNTTGSSSKNPADYK
ncbi:MAG: DNA polymerase IV [Eggerthellaceae bacterium]|nr:DNA polymerase IV [Eggerthellaceae bacterium]